MCQLAGGPLVLSKCLRHMHFSWCHLPEILHLNTLKEWGIQGAGKKKKKWNFKKCSWKLISSSRYFGFVPS